MILSVLRLVLAPALKLPIFRHDIEMAVSSYFARLHSPLIKERSKIVSHGTSQTKTGEQLTICLGIEPNFMNQFVFHRNVLLEEPPSRKRRVGRKGAGEFHGKSSSIRLCL